MPWPYATLHRPVNRSNPTRDRFRGGLGLDRRLWEEWAWGLKRTSRLQVRTRYLSLRVINSCAITPIITSFCNIVNNGCLARLIYALIVTGHSTHPRIWLLYHVIFIALQVSPRVFSRCCWDFCICTYCWSIPVNWQIAGTRVCTGHCFCLKYTNVIHLYISDGILGTRMHVVCLLQNVQCHR
jgi:hypothetical protein